MITDEHIAAARRRQKTRGHFSSSNPDAIFTIDDLCGFSGLARAEIVSRLKSLGTYGAMADERMASGALLYFFTLEEANEVLNFATKPEPQKQDTERKKCTLWTARQIADILNVKVGFIHNRIQRLHIKGKQIADKKHKTVAAYNIEQIRKIAEYKSDNYNYFKIDLEQTPWSLHELCRHYWPSEFQFPAQDDGHEWDKMDADILEEYQKDMKAAQYKAKHGEKKNDNERSNG